MWKKGHGKFVIFLSLFIFNSNSFAQIKLHPIGTYQSGIFNKSAAEIVAHDPNAQRLYVVNGNSGNIDVLDINDPSVPTCLFQINITVYGGSANSLAVHDGILAVAVEADPKQISGKTIFFNRDGEFLSSVTVGALPDMLTFTPNGQYVLVANEGEPAGYCLPGEEDDPEGSISIIDLKNGVTNLTQNDVRTADFRNFTRENIHPDIRIFGPGATVAQDLEPEYIAVDPDSSRAWVTLQENNAIAVLNIASATITNILSLGYKDYSDGAGFDPSDKDGGINITNWPVNGMYQPDAIVAFKVGGETYLITANEGDVRDYECFSEEISVENLELDVTVFDNSEELQQPENLGSLKTTTATGDADGDGLHEAIFNYGARSFSIWSADGQLVFDSGGDFEQITAELISHNFNSDNEKNDSFDIRSIDKGPEPEGITIGQVGDRIYAFIGFERVGGIMVYDVTNPYQPNFVQYVNNRNFNGNAEEGTAGDLGPEGLLFINTTDSPIEIPLLVTGNEVSGTTTIFGIFEQVFSVKLVKGLNMISVPLKPSVPYTARSLLTELSATTVIRLNAQLQKFEGFTADAPNDGFEIKGGQGYIVNVPQIQTVNFTGSAWGNTPSAPAVITSDETWAFVVSGKLIGFADNYTVTVINRRANTTVFDEVRSGYFAAAFGNLMQNAVVQSGDIIEIRVADSTGNFIGKPKVYTVTPEMLQNAFMFVVLEAFPQPETTMLLQNFPNPSNPETWIPYQLKEATPVNISIYDVTGNLVRYFDLGHREIGYYLSRSQAAYWDGRNNLNERVASGIYFYQIQAGEFSATRRMLILK